MEMRTNRFLLHLLRATLMWVFPPFVEWGQYPFKEAWRLTKDE